jgi:glycosyltransferase involved in cell wall biosynthesis
MKVLHVSLKPIYPIVDGGCVAIDNFLNLLVDLYGNVHHICISTPKHPFQPTIYEQYLPKEVMFLKDFYVNTKINPIKLVCSFLSSKSYQVQRFKSEDLNAYLNLISDEYDLIFFESCFLSDAINQLKTKAKIYVRTHNVEYNIWETKRKESTNWLSKFIYKRLGTQLKNTEINTYSKVDGLIHISKDDEHVFKQQLPAVKQITIPLTVTEDEFITPNLNVNSLLQFGFIGSAKWQPNTHAIQYLDTELFPLIKEKWNLAQLYIAGFGTENIQTACSSIIRLGAVQELSEFYGNISIVLAPLSLGSGLKIKVVEAIKHGKIVIGSTIAFEGLEFLSHKRIANTAKEFLSHIHEILKNKDFEHEISIQQLEIKHNFGRQTVLSNLKNFA